MIENTKMTPSIENSSESLKEDTKNTLIKSIVTQQSDFVLSNTATKTPKLPTTLGEAKTLEQVIFYLSGLGLSVIPIMKAQDANKYPQGDKQGKPLVNKDTGEILPKWNGKTPGYFDTTGEPQPLSWKNFINQKPDDKLIFKWFKSGDLNLGCLGNNYFNWLDLDAKNYTSISECEKAFYSWYEKLPYKCNYGRTPNGGFRVLIKFEEYTTGYKFSFSPDTKPVGELIGRGHYAVIYPSVGTNGKPYTIENNLPILEAKNPQAINLFLVGHNTDEEDKEESERENNAGSKDAVDILQLISKANKEIYNGSRNSGDRSADITALIRDAYGWSNWLNANGFDYSNDLTELVNECGANLGIDSDRIERILDSVQDKESCLPSCLKAGNDKDCWLKLKPLIPFSVFIKKCPKELLKTLRSENRLSTQKFKAPYESEVVEELVEIYKNRLAWDGTYKRWMLYQDNPQVVNYGIYQVLEESEVDKIILAHLQSKSYVYKGGYPASVKKLLVTELWVRKFYSIHPDKLPLMDGVLNLETMQLEEHCQANRFDYCLPYKWSEKSLGCQPILDWLLWMCEGDEAKRELLLAWMNCLILNKVEYQKYLILTGKGGAGKGTLIRLCTGLIGAANTADTTLNAMENDKFETANYLGKKLITISEVESFSGSLTTLKNITGQDNVRFEEKYKQGGSAPIRALLMIAANQDINTSDHSSAIARRRIAVYFNKVVDDANKKDLFTFTEDKQPTGEFVPYLAGLLEHILAMKPERVKQLITQTNLYVPSLKQVSMEVTVNSNPMAEWSNFNLVVRPDAKTNVGSLNKPSYDMTTRVLSSNNPQWLYPSYVDFCEGNGYRAVSSVKFSQSLYDLLTSQLKLDVTKDRGKTGAYFKGIALRTDKDLDPLLLTGELPIKDSFNCSKSFLEKIFSLCSSVSDTGKEPVFIHPEVDTTDDDYVYDASDFS